jgi:hypothetical protein
MSVFRRSITAAVAGIAAAGTIAAAVMTTSHPGLQGV